MDFLLWSLAALFGAAVIGGVVKAFLAEPVNMAPDDRDPPRRAFPTVQRGVTLDYVDGEGRPSVRPVVIEWIERTYEDDYMLHAYCKTRKARRTFRLSQVRRIVSRDGTSYDDTRRFFVDKAGADVSEFAVSESD